MTATILQFPRRNKGRVRKSEGLYAEGLHTIRERASAEGVEIFNLHRRGEIDQVVMLNYLLRAVINSLPREVRDSIKQRVTSDAVLGCDDTDRIAGTLASQAFNAFV